MNKPTAVRGVLDAYGAKSEHRSGTGTRGKPKRTGRGARASELCVVPGKRGNEPKDPAEGRRGRGTELLEGKMSGTTSPQNISTKEQRIAELASWTPKRVLNPLSHFIDIEWLKEAQRRTRKDGAPGVDGQTAAEYAAKLEENLQSLLDRAKSGQYFAPPVRRVHIPKDDGTTRPLRIPTYEDKVLQRAVVMLLEPAYERDFLECSYGFRPGRSAHQALEALWRQTMKMGGGWILEVDIKSYFDTLDHDRLKELVERRVGDGVVLRLIGKWLKAGVLDGGEVRRAEQGTPQGGVISPLLANIYLHYVLDEWFETEVKRRLNGWAFLIRYADDFVIGFTNQRDAEQMQALLAGTIREQRVDAAP